MENITISKEELLDKKRDYSPFLVHLTRDGAVPAAEVLETILDEKILKACGYYCLFNNEIDTLDEATKNKFKVVCFTETPLDLIQTLLEKVEGRTKLPEPYGLVFKKEYIAEKGGNPVFYSRGKLYDILWRVYQTAASNQFANGENRFLALINKCDKDFDFHWEREWRVIGGLKFNLTDIYCGICPEEEIPDFEKKYEEVLFISPHWGINRILDKLIEKHRQLRAAQDSPF